MQMPVATGEREHELLAPAADASQATSADPVDPSSTTLSTAAKGKKRAREPDSKLSPAPSTTDNAAVLPRQTGPTRRIDRVVYAGYEIRALFGSPYPLDELPGAAVSAADKSAAVARDGRIHARDAGGKFGKKEKKVHAGNKGEAASSVDGAPAEQHALAHPVEPEASVPDTHGLGVASGVAGRVEPVAEASGAVPLVGPDHNPSSASTSPSEAVPGSTLAPERPQPVVPVALDEQPLQPLAAGAPVACPPSVAAPTSLSIDAYPHPPSSSTLSPPGSVDDSHPTASTSSPNIRAERGKRGRFLPKPPGESNKSKRALERAARTSRPALVPESGGEPHLTQRQQRELARKAREEREREMAREGVERGGNEEVRLLVCDKCFKYMALPAVFAAHAKECAVKQPPGRRVYQRGAISIWEVDGVVAKLYCQNLCLFAKLFIEHKYMFFDVEGFTFYLLTETMAKQEWVLGYFSKEKVSYDDNNLACIVVFPPFRQKGWATLLIEFSYELSRRSSSTAGSPERPLSELGQKGYLAHWTAVLVRYFRAIFALKGEPPSIDTLLAAAPESTRSPSKGALNDDDDHGERRKRARRSKGWDGELPPGAATLAGSPAKAFTLRGGSSRPRAGVVDPSDGSFSFPTTLEELSRAVNLRADDVAFALVESGLAQYRRGGTAEVVKVEDDEEAGGAAEAGSSGAGEERELELVVTPELVEEVALRKGVKPMPMLDVAYVCNI
ncbi:hypothetical protein JCM3775_002210 [Rhodotorula graminis]